MTNEQKSHKTGAYIDDVMHKWNIRSRTQLAEMTGCTLHIWRLPLNPPDELLSIKKHLMLLGLETKLKEKQDLLIIANRL